MTMKVFTKLTKFVFCAFFLQTVVVADIQAQTEQEKEIIKVINQQASNWNQGDIEGFMQGYWQNDSLKFIGKKGLTYGWQAVLDNYKKSYPGKAGMGSLDFSSIHVQLLCSDFAFVTGAWNLSYTDRDALGGWFSLIFRKINGNWLIIADHSS
jgi:ketosteroid isomerase-like protein